MRLFYYTVFLNSLDCLKWKTIKSHIIPIKPTKFLLETKSQLFCVNFFNFALKLTENKKPVTINSPRIFSIGKTKQKNFSFTFYDQLLAAQWWESWHINQPSTDLLQTWWLLHSWSYSATKIFDIVSSRTWIHIDFSISWTVFMNLMYVTVLCINFPVCSENWPDFLLLLLLRFLWQSI